MLKRGAEKRMNGALVSVLLLIMRLNENVSETLNVFHFLTE